jgi:asparagine synthase (glutamine-hydrolysing)
MKEDLSPHEISYCNKLYSMLKEIITKEKARGLLLSGGLDSSIIASFQKPEYTFTVTLEGSYASDTEYARLVANQYGSNHITIKIKTLELLKIEEKIIELFRTFDPIFIRNASVIFAAVQKANELGVVTLLTGDGGDELFAGYNYLKRFFNDTKKLETEVKRLWDIMHFPSVTIGNFFNVKITSPYLDEKFMKFAKSIDISMKIGQYQNKLWGKFILRKCFEKWQHLEKPAWREKEAQEEGSGFSKIINYFENQFFTNKEFLDEIQRIKEMESVNIRNKEHLFYYITYRKYFPPPRSQKSLIEERICPDCNGSFRWNGKFCRICGAYPVNPIIPKG